MTLYHGSNIEVKTPRILQPNHSLDFGAGFYTTTNRKQAEDFACRVTRNRGTGVATLNTYQISESIAFDICDTLRFDGANDAWLDYVADHRTGQYSGPEHELVFGPVANDDVYETLQLFTNGAISREYALQRLKIKELFNQLVFKNDRALSFLHFIRSEVIHG